MQKDEICLDLSSGHQLMPNIFLIVSYFCLEYIFKASVIDWKAQFWDQVTLVTLNLSVL